MNIPGKLNQGDAYKFRSDLDRSDVTLTLVLRGPTAVELTGVRSGSGFDFPLPSTQSSALLPGRYSYALQSTLITEPAKTISLTVEAVQDSEVVTILSENQNTLADVRVGDTVSCNVFSGTPRVVAKNLIGPTLTLDSAALEDSDGALLNVFGVAVPGDRETLSTGTFEVVADLSQQAAGFDGRTQLELDLDACRAAIRALIHGGAVQEYTIGNRSVRKMVLADLIQLENKLKYEVYRERKAKNLKAGLGDGSNVLVRFK